eukprot:TRINITY_DN5021_c0_g1_i11.p1 TRINITY_DN5021_c0_g1~~TRINITY_DN5021_c0_g1_i11.p1  ORF type:complete len:390 (+),score=145.65 TRINITY_DN5021_c0_g1_i11:43-1212(+)
MAVSMTKEELKTAIINHGLSPPPSSAKKEEFVEMYNEHVAPVAEDAGEFSSDDEVTISPKKRSSQKSRTSAKSPKTSQTGGGTASADTTVEMTENSVNEAVSAADVDVDNLDDEQLFTLLKENGIDVGPIVDSTRPLYKKKLAALLRGETGPLNGSTNGAEFSDVDTEGEEDQPPLVTTPKERVSTRGKASSSSQKSTRSSARTSQKSPAATAAAASPLPTSPLATETSGTGLRKRLTINENTESSFLRSTPTPRRSIHSYKVTETTRQTVVKNAKGETTDMTHVVERVESNDAVDSAKSGGRAASIKKGLLILLIVAILAALIYYFVQGSGNASIQSIMDSLPKIDVSSSGDSSGAAVDSLPPAAPEAAAPAVEEPPAAAAPPAPKAA